MADRIVQNRLDARLKAPEAPFTSAAVGSGTYLNRIRYAEISADSSAENWQQTLAVFGAGIAAGQALWFYRSRTGAG
jgi:zinc protease